MKVELRQDLRKMAFCNLKEGDCFTSSGHYPFCVTMKLDNSSVLNSWEFSNNKSVTFRPTDEVVELQMKLVEEER